MPQLSATAAIPDAEWLRGVVDSNSVMLIARLNGAIAGTLTVAMYQNPDGRRAHIDAVVVDEAARGRGIARKLSLEGIACAKAWNARTIELTSNPKREAANKLYQSIGFKIRETNLYRYEG